MKTHFFLTMFLMWLLPSVAMFSQLHEQVNTEQVQYEATKKNCLISISVDYPVKGDAKVVDYIKQYIHDTMNLYGHYAENESLEPEYAHAILSPKMEVGNVKDMKKYVKAYCDNCLNEVYKNCKRNDDFMFFERSLKLTRTYQTPLYVVYLAEYRYGRGIDVTTTVVPCVIRKLDGMRISQPFKEEEIPEVEKMVCEHPELYLEGDGNLDMVETINEHKRGTKSPKLDGRLPLPASGGWITRDYVYMQYAALELFGDWCMLKLRFNIADMLPYLKDEIREMVVI